MAKSKNPKPCAIAGCLRPLHARGLCCTHYRQALQGRCGVDLPPRVDVQRSCQYPGCGKPHRGHGYCNGHLQQIRSGRELAPLGSYVGQRFNATPKPAAKAADPKVKALRRPLKIGQRVWLDRGGVRDLRIVVGYRGDVVLLGDVE